MTDTTRRSLLAALATLPVMGQPFAWAQDKWPTRPIKLMVGFPPGGGGDGTARLVAAKLAEVLGQPVIVENKTGATGTICSDIVAKSAPDGYTLQAANANSNVIGALLLAKGKFHPVDDFTPIGIIATSPNMLCHHPKHKFKDVADLIAYAKKNPGKLTFASSGIGSLQHFAAEDFKLRSGVDLLHVPFKGTGEGLAALLAGDVDLTFSSTGTAVPQVKGGKLTLLAVTTSKRLPDYPNVPAIAETLPGYEIITWYGIVGPKGVPQPMVERINAAMQAFGQSPEVIKRLDEFDAKPSSMTPKQFGDFLRAEVTRYQKLIDDAKITAA
jgi:tripartite-type tricarboxylate transporter receptor subunit TctC